MSYSKEEFTEIMVLADRIEDIIDGQDMVTSLLAMTWWTASRPSLNACSGLVTSLSWWLMRMTT